MKFVAIRSLGDEGGPLLSKDEVRAYASEFVEVWDQSLNDGEGDYREALPADHFPKGGNANAPDLSLMAKARAGFHGPVSTGINQLLKGMGGPEYIYSLLTGYTGEEKTSAGVTLYENTAYPGGWISMGPPLYGEDVEFADGHKNDLEHLSEDISAFLMWTAEPKLNDRKRAGLVGVLILGFLTLMLFLANKALWRLTLLPLADKLLSAIAEGLETWFPDARLAIDLDRIPALAEDRQALWSQINAANFLTDAEKREMLGLPALGLGPETATVQP